MREEISSLVREVYVDSIEAMQEVGLVLYFSTKRSNSSMFNI